MLAQSLVEYGSLAEVGVALERARYVVTSWASDLTPVQWLGVGGAVVLFLFFWTRRSNRY